MTKLNEFFHLPTSHHLYLQPPSIPEEGGRVAEVVEVDGRAPVARQQRLTRLLADGGRTSQ